VEFDCGPGVPCRLIHVDIDVSDVPSKPFLGGYCHRSSGSVFHHAATQTPVAPKPPPPSRACRTTQTVELASRGAQTLREACTQMARPGLALDTRHDRVVDARAYVTAREVLEWRAAAALTVQRFARGWAARRRAGELRGHKAEREAFLADRQAKQAAEVDETRRREVQRRMHPVRPVDFRILESELEAWRRTETARNKAAGLDAIKEQVGFCEAWERGRSGGWSQELTTVLACCFSPAPSPAVLLNMCLPQSSQEALRLLLAKETRLLQTIDRLRVNAKHEIRDARAHEALGAIAGPKTWELKNGAKVVVHTPGTTRGRELQQLYRGLVLPGLSIDERLDLLLHVKWAAAEFDCTLTKEIVQLIDREADLLNRWVESGGGVREGGGGRDTATLKAPLHAQSATIDPAGPPNPGRSKTSLCPNSIPLVRRGRNPGVMAGLRRRLASLFLEFCRTPAFNPAAAALARAAEADASSTSTTKAAAAASEVFVYADPERAAARAAPVPIDTEIRAW